MNSALIGATMSALGLGSSYGAYLDRLPEATLGTLDLVSMLAPAPART